MHYAGRILELAAIASLAAATVVVLRLAVADWQFRAGTPQGVARAVELNSRNAEYWGTRAMQMEYDGQDSTAMLGRAAALTPLASAPRIRLGLAAELRGDAAAAEQWLLEAARVDRQFEPRWSLANFYFRAARPADFWTWARAALEVSYGDRRPLFDLCRRVSDDPLEVLARAVPDRADAIAAFLSFLLEARMYRAVPAAAFRLAAGGDPSYRSLLLGACDALLEVGDFASAAEVWRAAGEARPMGVTHPDFEAPRSGQGFDWRWARPAGVSYTALDTERALRIKLDGRQPESAVLLRQPIGGLRPGARYMLQWESRTRGSRAPAGLTWRVAAQTAEVRPAEDWSARDASFVAPPGPWWLELWYQRGIGEVRAEATIELRRVRMAETK